MTAGNRQLTDNSEGFRPAQAWVHLLAIAASFTLLAPFIAGGVVATALAWRKRQFLGLGLPIGLVLLLATINSLKWPSSDLFWYYEYVELVHRTPLGETLTGHDTFLSIRPEEFGFKLWVWATALVSGGSKVFFTLATSSAIYGATLAAMVILTQKDDLKPDPDRNPERWIPTVYCAALLLGITFSLTAHLVRQYLAGALFVLGFAIWTQSQRRIRWTGLILCLASVTIHSSAALLLLPLILTMAFRHSVWPYIAGLFGIILALTSGVAESIFQLSNQVAFLKEDGQQSTLLIAADLLVLVLAMALVLSNRRPSDKPRRPLILLLALSFAFMVPLLLIRDVPLLFFRTYMYFEFMRTILVGVVFASLVRRSGLLKPTVAIGLLMLTSAVCLLRASASDWSYFPDSEPGFTYSMLGVMDRWAAIQGN